MPAEALLELKGVKTFFRVGRGLLKAVNGVDMAIRQGETVGLVGESGCGKSTLGRTIMRLHRPESGQVLFKGRDVWSYGRPERKQYAKEVQMIFQDPSASLDPLMVIHDCVSEGLRIHGARSKSERYERAVELLGTVGLSKEHANRFPHEFSGGQRQRVGIARALALRPELIVCDEPISALDVSIQAQIVNLLKKLQVEMGLAYLFITHDLSMVRQIADRIAVMYLGSIMEMAPSGRLYARHRHPYTEALLSAIPIADPDVEAKRRRILLAGDVASPVGLGSECGFRKRCPRATELCGRERPALAEVEPGHFVACHRLGGQAPNPNPNGAG
ncbi:MAG: ABC transporter ATP-binding protein [Clostridiales bacterium]|jgi:oligopeptide/dipeptide ABC transporter ATP-binding protein|nr:ABC transporter ATP-binding protein [Clostridiales bacterium]